MCGELTWAHDCKIFKNLQGLFGDFFGGGGSFGFGNYNIPALFFYVGMGILL